jgi:hypothetical protein
VPLLIQRFGNIDPQGAFAIMGMAVGDMKEAGVSTPVLSGFYAFYNGIEPHILYLANTFKLPFVAFKVLGALEVVNNLFDFVQVLLCHLTSFP